MGSIGRAWSKLFGHEPGGNADRSRDITEIVELPMVEHRPRKRRDLGLSRWSGHGAGSSVLWLKSRC